MAARTLKPVSPKKGPTSVTEGGATGYGKLSEVNGRHATSSE
jgi:hypothetical protein